METKVEAENTKKEDIKGGGNFLTIVDTNLDKLYTMFFNTYHNYIKGKTTSEDVLQRMGYLFKYADIHMEHIVNNNYGLYKSLYATLENSISEHLPKRAEYKKTMKYFKDVVEKRYIKDDKNSFKPKFQGTYGCIYQPPLKCTDKTLNDKYSTGNYVLKYSKYNPEDNEYLISRKLLQREIKKDDKKDDKKVEDYFTLLQADICTVDVPAMILGKYCDPMRNEISRFAGYFLKWGGIDIYRFISNTGSILKIEQLIYMTRHLLEAIKIMRENNITHFDLHRGNILVGITKDSNPAKIYNPTIIDFGISSIDDSFESIKKANKIDVHFALPLFVNMYRSIYQNRGEESQRIVNSKESKAILTLYEMYFGNNYIVNDSNLKLMTRTWKTMDLDFYLEDAIIPNLDKVDVYMLGYTLKILLNSIEPVLRERFQEDRSGEKDGEKLDLLFKLYEHMTDVTRSEQYDYKQALKYMDEQLKE